MKRLLLPAAVTIIIVGLFVWTLVFLYNKSQADPISHQTDKPFESDILKKTVASGAIVPRREILIKPRISGVIDELFVEPGQIVKKGDRLARIKVIPNMVNLNSAEARVKTAQVRLRNAKKERNRFQGLFDRKLISEAELAARRLDYELAQQEVSAAKSNLQLIREGASRGSGKVQNEVTSTVEGMILDVPIEEGVSVIETNNFNEGTTIAAVANMRDLIFKGTVDESEVGKLEIGMDLDIRIGALDKEVFEGKLEYISPKGVDKDGAIQFEIRAAIDPRDGVFVRANYSANADIVLDRRDKVLAVREAWVVFEKGKTFVEVEVGPQQFEKRPVKLGLSDGINVEILEGLDQKVAIKVPATEGGKGKGKGKKRRGRK
ncbi:MAG: efflux RND transporter periplasmic adaptor subunit [Deltaproteobacteria bacterium]|nr:efflux RND transporter periplasmic adaptor subunit [Deltaproteobacteria bacterium]